MPLNYVIAQFLLAKEHPELRGTVKLKNLGPGL